MGREVKILDQESIEPVVSILSSVRTLYERGSAQPHLIGAALCRCCPTWSLSPSQPELFCDLVINTENKGKGTAAEAILQALNIHHTPEPEKTKLDPQPSYTDGLYQSTCECLGAAAAAEGGSGVRTFFLHVWEPGGWGFLKYFLYPWTLPHGLWSLICDVFMEWCWELSGWKVLRLVSQSQTVLSGLLQPLWGLAGWVQPRPQLKMTIFAVHLTGRNFCLPFNPWSNVNSLLTYIHIGDLYIYVSVKAVKQHTDGLE